MKLIKIVQTDSDIYINNFLKKNYEKTRSVCVQVC